VGSCNFSTDSCKFSREKILAALTINVPQNFSNQLKGFSAQRDRDRCFIQRSVQRQALGKSLGYVSELGHVHRRGHEANMRTRTTT